MKKSILILCLAFLFVTLFYLYYNQKKDAVTIGAIVPLTGNAAQWGKQAKDSIELALELYNKNAALNVQVNYQDTKAEPKEALSAARFLVTQHQVPAIIGGITSATTLSAASFCEQNKVLLISPVASSPKITTAGEYIYRLWPSDVFEADFSATWLIKNKHTKVAIVFLIDDYGLPLKQTFETIFKSKGGKIIVSEGYNAAVKDFRTIISKLQNTKADAIYLISHYNDAAIFLRQKLELGINLPVIGTADLKNEILVELAGNATENVHFPNRKGFDADSDNLITADFVKQFSQKYNRNPGLVEAQAFDTANLILSAIKKDASDSSEIKRFFDDLSSEHPLKGVTGDIYFDTNGDLVSAEFKMMTIKDGKFIYGN